MNRIVLPAVLALILLALIAAPLASADSSPTPTPSLYGGAGANTGLWAVVAIVALGVVAVVIWLVRRRKRSEAE
jgi:hypothetical protein